MSDLTAGLSQLYRGAHAFEARSGSAALIMALMAAIPPGRGEVLMPATCCPAVLFATKFAGFSPVIVDVRPEMLNPSVEDFAGCVTNQTVAIIAVHGFGVPCDLGGIIALAKSRDIRVIEDACLSLTPISCDVPPDATILSFGYDKPISVSGGGGALILHEEDLVAPATEALRANAFLSQFPGGQAEVCAALATLSQSKQARLANVARYIDGLTAPWLTFREDARAYAWWRLSGLANVDRAAFLEAASRAGLMFTTHYRSLGALMTGGHLPGADQIDAQILNLFVRPETSCDEIDRKIEFLNGYAP